MARSEMVQEGCSEGYWNRCDEVTLEGGGSGGFWNRSEGVALGEEGSGGYWNTGEGVSLDYRVKETFDHHLHEVVQYDIDQRIRQKEISRQQLDLSRKQEEEHRRQQQERLWRQQEQQGPQALYITNYDAIQVPETYLTRDV